jgi:hypothetical protein
LLDHVEPEPKELTEQVPAEETNPELAKGKPRCIPLKSLTFTLNQYFMLSLIVHEVVGIY